MDVHIWIRKLVKEIECEVNNFTYFKEWDRAAGDGRIEFDHFWVVECIQWHDLFPLIKRVPLRPRHHSDLFLSFKDQSVSCWVTFCVCELALMLVLPSHLPAINSASVLLQVCREQAHDSILKLHGRSMQWIWLLSGKVWV